jgi:hypothetical protein
LLPLQLAPLSAVITNQVVIADKRKGRKVVFVMALSTEIKCSKCLLLHKIALPFELYYLGLLYLGLTLNLVSVISSSFHKH